MTLHCKYPRDGFLQFFLSAFANSMWFTSTCVNKISANCLWHMYNYHLDVRLFHNLFTVYRKTQKQKKKTASR